MEPAMELSGAKMRVARPTSDLTAGRRFYMEGLGLELLGAFEDHDSFNGVMLGFKGQPFHIEITCEHGAGDIPAPSTEDLVVFYVPDREAWQAVVARMENLGYAPVKSGNAYWDKNGVTFADPDGFRVVLQNAASPV